MHFTIIGAEAIGGLAGSHLVRAGHPVLFVDSNRDHVAVINTAGIRVEGIDNFEVRAPAVTPEGLAAAVHGCPLQVLLLAVKAQYTAHALEPAVPLMDDNSVVVSLANGLNERVIAARVGARRTIGAFTQYGSEYEAPGRVLFASRGEFYLGELDGRVTPRLEALAEIFRASFAEEVALTDNIWGHLWAKLGFSSLLYATALCDDTIADTFANHDYRPLLADLGAEVVRVADAEGVRCERYPWYDPEALRFGATRDWGAIHRAFDRRVAVQRRSLKQRTAAWQELATRHRRTAVDGQPGAVTEVARAHGLAVPLHGRLIDIVHEIEKGRRRPVRANLDELARLDEELYPDG